MVTSADLEFSTFQRRTAYRYIRAADRLPTIPETRSRYHSEIVCKVKLFNPTGRATWYLAAYDPETRTAWGVADVDGPELGPIAMPAIVGFRGRFGLPIERDLHYSPRTMAVLLSKGEA